MDYEIHLMTVEEAVMVFELSGQPAMMFRNKAHLGLNMLHRRDDGSIGWVDPGGTVTDGIFTRAFVLSHV